MKLVIRLRSWRPTGGGPYKNRSFGTPSGSGPQSQIAVAQLSHEASLHQRSAEPMWRFCSAIHGSAHFWTASPQTNLQTYMSAVSQMLNLRRHAYSLLERPGGGSCSQTVEGQGRPETSAQGCARSVSVNKAHRPAQLQNMRLKWTHWPAEN